jgi:hypothetical protein
MDHETNKQEPSSEEGREMKVGDEVWVLCEVLEPEYQGRVECLNHNYVLHPYVGEIRPVEPPAKESTRVQKLAEQALKGIWAANDSVNGRPVVKDSLTTEPNCSEILDSSSDPLQVGDAVRFVSLGHKRHGTRGVLKSIHHGPKNGYLFISDCGQFHRYCTAAELRRIIKRYRTPTLADLANGPVACEYRDSDEEHWRSGFLVYILNGAIPFLCVNEKQKLSGQWDQCRIEVGE